MDENGCPLTDDGNNNDTDAGTDPTSDGGCGCANDSAPASALAFGLVGLIAARRRR